MARRLKVGDRVMCVRNGTSSGRSSGGVYVGDRGRICGLPPAATEWDWMVLFDGKSYPLGFMDDELDHTAVSQFVERWRHGIYP